MTTVEDRFFRTLHHGSRAWKQALERRLKASGLSHAGWLAVTTAALAKAPLSQTELAQRLGIEGATMVAMIDRLVAAGLMEREPSDTDRRVKRVVVTNAGTKLYRQVKLESDALRKEFVSKIDKTKLLIATELLEQLQTMADAVS